MIETPTCLVLGAGASIPYGFPSGPDLKTQILAGVGTADRSLFSPLRDVGHGRVDQEAFAEAFRGSSQESIDLFLANRPDLMEIGKAALAAVLMRGEVLETLIDLPQAPGQQGADHWYSYLWGALHRGGKDSFPGNRLSVVTFNYDRSLERFLTLAYARSFNVSEPDAWNHITKLVPIVHVHGDLGVLCFESTPSDTNRQYKPDLGPLRLATGRVRVLSEGQRESREFAQARKLLLQADKVIVLGCAYHPENMERLEFDRPPRDGQLRIGSGFGVYPREAERAKKRWSIMEVGDQGWRNREFLRQREAASKALGSPERSGVVRSTSSDARPWNGQLDGGSRHQVFRPE